MALQWASFGAWKWLSLTKAKQKYNTQINISAFYSLVGLLCSLQTFIFYE